MKYDGMNFSIIRSLSFREAKDGDVYANGEQVSIPSVVFVSKKTGVPVPLTYHSLTNMAQCSKTTESKSNSRNATFYYFDGYHYELRFKTNVRWLLAYGGQVYQAHTYRPAPNAVYYSWSGNWESVTSAIKSGEDGILIPDSREIWEGGASDDQIERYVEKWSV